MLKSRLRHSTLQVTGRLSRVLRVLLKDEAASGKFLLAAVLIAILFMNSPWSVGFETFWKQTLSISLGDWRLSETLQHWIDEGLMAIFFLVAGLEIKRELVRGELRTLRTAGVPIMAAIGGMLIPALMYIAINNGQPGFSGWGIPMATDIAIVMGVLALLGNRIPGALRVFLLTLAVVDDIGAILIIAIFYSQAVNLTALAVAAAIMACIGVLQWLRLLRLSIFVLLGIALWLAVHASGIHAAIAGALLGLSAPIMSRRKDKRAIAGRLERALIPVSAFVVVPLFALANAGVAFSTRAFDEEGALFVGAGIIAGLVAGKVTGVVGATWLLVRFTSARLPAEVNWRLLFGAGLLAGIGFTLSIFVAELAFVSNELVQAAKISIFIASFISAVAGLWWLWRATNKNTKPNTQP